MEVYCVNINGELARVYSTRKLANEYADFLEKAYPQSIVTTYTTKLDKPIPIY